MIFRRCLARDAALVLTAALIVASFGAAAEDCSQEEYALSPSTECYAGEPAGFDDLARSLAAGEIRRNEKLIGSFCDALLAPEPGKITFPIARRLLAGSIAASDEEVSVAMELAFREFKLVVEPGGAVGLAAVMTGRLPARDRTVCVVCSGGNVDGAAFREALATALRRAA